MNIKELVNEVFIEERIDSGYRYRLPTEKEIFIAIPVISLLNSEGVYFLQGINSSRLLVKNQDIQGKILLLDDIPYIIQLRLTYPRVLGLKYCVMLNKI